MLILKKVLKSPLLYLILVSGLALKGLFHPGVWLSADLVLHIARLASFYDSLTQGYLFPRWGGNLYYGYGYPVLMILYPLVHYIGSLFHFLGFSFTESIKLVFIIPYLLTTVFMYLWLKDWLGKQAAIIGTILYQFAPYRFVQIYVSAVVGENLAFFFIPLTLWRVFKLFTKKTILNLVLAILSFAGLILSHNGVSVFSVPIIASYCIYLFLKESKQKKLFFAYILVFFILPIVLTAFYWLPAIFEVSQFTNWSRQFTLSDFQNYYLNLDQLIYSPWGYGSPPWQHELAERTVMIGIIHWLIALLSIGFLWRLRKRINQEWILTLIMVMIFFLSTFFMLRVSSWLLPLTGEFLRHSEQPYRLTTFTVVASSILGALLAAYLKGRKKRKFVLFLSFTAVILTATYWRVNNWDTRQSYTDDFWLNQYQGTTDIGEFRPIWGNYTFPAPAKIQPMQGKIDELEITIWKAQKHEYHFNAGLDTIIIDNTAYYPGWRVYVDGKKVPIQFQHPTWPGLITYPVSPGYHQVKVVFGESKIRLICDLASLGGLVVLLMIIIYGKKNSFANLIFNF